MKMNFDCVRAVLLALEPLIAIEDDYHFKHHTFEEIADILPEYDKKEVYYSLLKLDEAGFIKCFKNEMVCDSTSICVYDISYDGHNYLNSIRNDKVWNKIKEGALSLTFGIVTRAAESFILHQLIP